MSSAADDTPACGQPVDWHGDDPIPLHRIRSLLDYLDERLPHREGYLMDARGRWRPVENVIDSL